MHRATEHFTLEVPERDVDTADGSHREPSALPWRVVIHVCPHSFGLDGVSSNDPAVDQVPDQHHHRFVGLHRTRVPYAVQSRLVRTELDQQPVALSVVMLSREAVKLYVGYCWHGGIAVRLQWAFIRSRCS